MATNSIPEVTAETWLEINAHCPHCGEVQDLMQQLSESLGGDLRAEDIYVEVSCEYCDQEFAVTKVTF